MVALAEPNGANGKSHRCLLELPTCLDPLLILGDRWLVKVPMSFDENVACERVTLPLAVMGTEPLLVARSEEAVARAEFELNTAGEPVEGTVSSAAAMICAGWLSTGFKVFKGRRPPKAGL